MEYQIKNIFIEKSYRKCAENELFINLVNNPGQPLHARNSLKERYFERGLLRSLKEGNFIFSFKPSSFQ